MRRKLNTFEIYMQKFENITYTTIYLNLLFGILYQKQVIKIMRLQKFWILLPNRFTWSNEPWNTAHKTTSLPQTKWLLVSTFLYQLSSALLHWWRRTNFKQEGIIVGTVSTNICPLRGTYFYVNRRTKSKRKNIFVGMVAHFKNTSQWDRSVRTFLLTGWWNYCTQSYQISHYISKYISKSSIHF